jgi:hypothetical protein
MGWVNPTSRNQGDTISPAIWNQDAVDNPQFLYDNLGILDAKLGYSKLTGAGTFSLTSIPSDYDALIVLAMLNNAGSGQVYMRFNADTGSNYGSHRRRWGQGVSDAAEEVSAGRLLFDASQNAWGFYVMHIGSYGNDDAHKVIRLSGGHASAITASGQIMIEMIGYWIGGAPEAITQIDILPSSGNFAADSWVGLYGAQSI